MRRIEIWQNLTSDKPAYRLIETIETLDGPRSRITDKVYSIFAEARAVKEEYDGYQ